jgi:protein-L-isoaspartate O-methyltransferase
VSTSSQTPVTSSTRIAVPRDKGRRPAQALVARGIALLARVVPARVLANALLTIAWLARRHAWEQSLRWLGSEESTGVVRPHVPGFVLDAVEEGDAVIDIGCGRGMISEAVAPRAGRVVAVDHDATAVKQTAAACARYDNVDVVQGDALEVMRERGPFDVAVLLHALEHLDDPAGALRDIGEHARRVVIEVPDFNADPLNAMRLRIGAPFYMDDDHVSEFTVESLHETLTAAGWGEASVRASGGMLLAVADRPGA